MSIPDLSGMVVSNPDLLERHMVQPDILASSSESDGCTPTSLSILSEVEVEDGRI